LALLPCLLAQGSSVLSVGFTDPVTVKRGQTIAFKLPLELKKGFHVNSNQPSEDYLIPLRLTWNAAPLEVEQVIYPKPALEKTSFSPKPVSLFNGKFEIVTEFRAPANAAAGFVKVKGKLRYQACNQTECLRPVTLEVEAQVQVQ
jgi:thioredoxin:protein disulfide reductase